MIKYLLPFVLFAGVFYYATIAIEDLTTSVTENVEQTNQKVAELEQDLSDSAYQTHIDQLNEMSLVESRKALEEQYEKLETEYNNFKSDETQQKLVKIESIIEKYNSIQEKNDRNGTAGIDTSVTDETYQAWGIQLLNEEYDGLNETLSEKETELENQYSEYLASLPTPTPRPIVVAAPPAAGYSYQSVSNSRGTFGVYLIKMSLSEVTVKTVAANNDNCANNCPAKSLADYINENNAYAGMHGTYFCPPDYSSCASKIYSYDFGVYDSNQGKWLNQHALSWNDLGLITFNGSSPTYYSDSKNYGDGAVTAGMSNFPSLLAGGNVVVNEGGLTSYQRDVRGSRGAVGTDGQSIYLALVTSATVPDTAYVMQSLGATDALNLDGGGSSAMYINGSYKVGPGRSLPNAILLVR